MDTIKTAGRYKLNEEDKAKQVPLRLNQSYIDRLEALPGKNNAERVKYLVDNMTDLMVREHRQIEEVKKIIGPLYRLAKDLMSCPELKADKDKWKKRKQSFEEGYKSLTRLINLYHFDIHTLKKYLTSSEIIEVDIIFNASAFLRNCYEC